MTPCPAGPGVTSALIQYEQSLGRASRERTAAWGIWKTSLKPSVLFVQDKDMNSWWTKHAEYMGQWCLCFEKKQENVSRMTLEVVSSRKQNL